MCKLEHEINTLQIVHFVKKSFKISPIDAIQSDSVRIEKCQFLSFKKKILVCTYCCLNKHQLQIWRKEIVSFSPVKWIKIKICKAHLWLGHASIAYCLNWTKSSNYVCFIKTPFDRGFLFCWKLFYSFLSLFWYHA